MPDGHSVWYRLLSCSNTAVQVAGRRSDGGSSGVPWGSDHHDLGVRGTGVVGRSDRERLVGPIVEDGVSYLHGPTL